MLDEQYWKSTKSNEALVLVRNEDPKELTSICTISPFKLREEWLNYLVKLENSERELLVGHNCKLVCGSTRNSTIKIFCEEDDHEFLSCFHIINADTHAKVEHDIKSIYSIIKQESIEEQKYSMDNCCLDSLYKDIVVIMKTSNKLLSCRIPLHYILTLFIRSKLRRIRERLGSYQSSDLTVSNIRKTMWIYQIENNMSANFISCFNTNNVCPYILLVSKDEEEEPRIHLCLVSLNVVEFDLAPEVGRIGSPLNIDCSDSFMLEDGGSSQCEILENGIGFYPLRSSYIWVVSVRKVVRRQVQDRKDLSMDVNGFFADGNDDLKIEDLSEGMSSDFYMFESTRNNIKKRGVMTCANYNIDFFRILNLTCRHEGKDQLENREYIVRAVSSTSGPNGLFCFDFKLRVSPNNPEDDKRMTILSLVFMPILEKEVNNFSISSNQNHHENPAKNNYLNYSFGKSDEHNPNLRGSCEIDSLTPRGSSGFLKITTLCVIPNYVLLLFGASLDAELNENFPLIFCGLSNGEWRTYSIKSSLRTKKGEMQGKLNLGADDIGFFVLKGVHRLVGDELSIRNQLGGSELIVSSSFWSFDRNTITSTLSVAASNNIGNVFMWCLEKERRRLSSRLADSRRRETTREDSNSEVQPQGVSPKLQVSSGKKKQQGNGAKPCTRTSRNRDILETMDEHLKRIDERLRKVKLQEEIISDAEKLQEKVRKNRERTRPKKKLTRGEASSFVPDCLNRSVSPRKGCSSCNLSDPDERKPFFFKSKYDNFDHMRYRSFYKDDDHEYLFQLNNFLNIECIYKSELHVEAGTHRKSSQMFDKIVNFGQLCSKWSKHFNNDVLFDDILNGVS